MQATIPLGTATFDVADRLAIVNLLGSHGWLLDERLTANYCALFTPSPTIDARSPTNKLFEGWGGFKTRCRDR